MGDEQSRRVGLNESIFREVNDQIESLNKGLGPELRSLAVICECANGECTERIEIDLPAYEEVRSDARRYIIVPGHELPEFEAVVDRGDGYDVVEKSEGEAAKLAEETDPRS